MILAAGKGERMMPLTRNTPKPLLLAGGRPLIQYHVEALAKSGVEEIIINTGRKGELIEKTLGNGDSFGVSLIYSHEGKQMALPRNGVEEPSVEYLWWQRKEIFKG